MNSREFWESYFEESWAPNDGPRQSQHFMIQLLRHLPPPELAWLLRGQHQILDWGCATGEGTAVLASLLPNCPTYGLDFAKTAVRVASERHPEAQFLWTQDGSIPSDFDVIITSNCLEHFEDPLTAVKSHLPHCGYLYVALVPYKEHPLHEQHAAQFRDESFPEQIDSFIRVATVPFPVENVYWPGSQVLAVYGSKPYIDQRVEAGDDVPLTALLASFRKLATITAQEAALVADARSQGLERRNLAAQVATMEATIGALGVELDLARTEAARVETMTQELGAAREASRRLTAELSQSHHRLLQLDVLHERLYSCQAELATATKEAAKARAETSDQLRQNADLVEQVRLLSSQLGTSTRLLAREESTIIRPVARRAWRRSRALARRLPPDVQDMIRAELAPVVRVIAPKSEQAVFYRLARQRRAGRLTASDRTAQSQPSGGAALTATQQGLDDFFRTFRDEGQRKTFVIFPVIDWHFRFQRPQQLAKVLGEQGHDVIYIAPDFATAPNGAPFERIGAPVRNVSLVRLACNPPHPRIYEDLLLPDQVEQLAAALTNHISRDSARPVVRLVQHPFWAKLMRSWDEGMLVYDMMDEHAGFQGNGSWLAAQEEDLVSIADLVTVSSDKLLSRLGGAKATALLRNAADREHFLKSMSSRGEDAPYCVGYYGAIAHWFDADIVSYCARRHPEWRFELVGSTFQADLLDLELLPNVVLRGEQPYTMLPTFLSNWDVAIIPFKIIPLTLATNPVKVYEFLTAGKPVVATPLPELDAPPIRDWVRTAATPPAFELALRDALKEARDGCSMQARSEAVKGESWDQRGRQLEDEIDHLSRKCSVVVVCYGQLELTKACIRSLLERTQYPDWELIVVDNASLDDTAKWLTSIAPLSPRIKLVLNDSNRGFAGGVNDGVRNATGDYIVILNNDVVVTRSWLGRLVRHLDRDENVGLVGAVTNNIGNEAAVNVNYGSSDEMRNAAWRYTSSHFRQVLEVDNVAFFATGLRRSTWEIVGALDEGYGLGFFEDDDYCVRVRKQGMKIVIAEDVFVHHELSASFGALGEERKRAEFESSKARFEMKWGPWRPHRYRESRDV